MNMVQVIGDGIDVTTNMSDWDLDDFRAAVADKSRCGELVTLKDTFEHEHSFRLGDVKSINVLM